MNVKPNIWRSILQLPMCIFLSHQTFSVWVSFWQPLVTTTALQKIWSSMSSNPSQNAQFFYQIVEVEMSIYLYVSKYNQSVCYRIRLLGKLWICPGEHLILKMKQERQKRNRKILGFPEVKGSFQRSQDFILYILFFFRCQLPAYNINTMWSENRAVNGWNS